MLARRGADSCPALPILGGGDQDALNLGQIVKGVKYVWQGVNRDNVGVGGRYPQKRICWETVSSLEA